MFPNERTRIIRQTDRPIHQIRQTGKLSQRKRTKRRRDREVKEESFTEFTRI